MTTKSLNGHTLSDAIDAGGLNWRHWLFFGLLFFLFVTDGMDATIVSHIFPSLIAEWGVSIGGGISLVVTGGFIFMGIGALISGRLSDLLGRKVVLIAAGLLFAIGTGLGGTSPDFNMFMTWRFLACLGIGAVLPTGVALLSDLIPGKQRVAMVAASYAGLGIGTSLGAVLAGFVLPTLGWQTLMYLGGILPLVFIALIWLIIPESPIFLAHKGHHGRARHALLRINPRINVESIDLASAEISSHSTRGLKQLLTVSFRRTTIALWVFAFFSLGTQMVIVQYLPLLLQQPSPGMDTAQSSTIFALYGFASVLSMLLLGSVLVKLPMYRTVAVAITLAAFTAVLVSVTSDAGFGTLLITLTAAGFFIPAAVGPTRNVLTVGAYPADLKGTGLGVMELYARLGSAGLGAAGGVVAGAGIGLGGFFLVLLVPLGILGGSLGVLKRSQQRKTKQAHAEEKPLVNSLT